ncbi:hypothetical protein [Actinacidiphila yanglinensis]|uniref:hypothetical protein n=1 Tax=Actinacidiphila yanglinensis TaxID=310779 RepID=UPI000CDE602A|nr:hypothetical protein [Actinacidiphila yanglinensis]
MAALTWLLIPVAAAVAAAIWGRWAARRRTTGDGASLAGYERFRQAMQTSSVSPAAAGAPSVPRADREVPPDDEEDSPRGPVAGPVP